MIKSSSKLEAAARADAVRNMMPNPERWQADVWRRDGWWFRVHSGPVSIHAWEDGGYSCIIAGSMANDGNAGPWTTWDGAVHETPQAAVEHELLAVSKWLEGPISVLSAIMEVMEATKGVGIDKAA
jgi:hypothetical protein